jgi:hypothetical protein
VALRLPRPRLLFLVPVVVVGAAAVVAWPSFAPRVPFRSATDAAPSNAQRCWFNFDMRLMKQEIPDIVGDCVENQRYNPENGDTLQRTTGGLMIWRRADRSVAFTDGNRTWARGPNGLESRWNDERFEWEIQAEIAASTAVAKPGSTPAPAATKPAPVASAPTPTPRAVVVTTPEPSLSGALVGGAAAAIPSTNEIISTATELVLVSSLKSSGLPVQNVQTLTAANDPERLLGKPGQYSSKIAWRDQRAASEDATIELFADEASMRTRLQALQAIPKTAPQYTPYLIGDPAKKALVRLPKGMSPDGAQGYQRWLSTIH